MSETYASPSARLQHIAAELVRLADDLSASEKDNSVRSFLQSFAETTSERMDERYAATAAEIYRLRRRRERKFTPGLLSDPCWDILLDLFANTVRCNPVSVTSACLASNVPTSTAMRWLGILERDGMLERHPDPLDRRVVLVRLTLKGLERMRSIFAELSQHDSYFRDGIGSQDVERS